MENNDKLRNFKLINFILISVIEVANGDYGDFVPLLSTAAKRSDFYSKCNGENEDESMPIIKVDTLGCIDTPLLKKQHSEYGKEIIRVPSEWSKFWTLVGRCHVNCYRDWVRSLSIDLEQHSKLFLLFCVLI